LSAPTRTVRRARVLRKAMSLPEVLLWRELRTRPGGLKFRRQFPISGYVVDFACLSCRLVIEIDGAAHDGPAPQSTDAAREQRLRAAGYSVLRISAADVFKDLESVVRLILTSAEPLHRPADGPPPRAGEDLA